jgi:16S rRNA C1402 N4-methylase RsmH
MPCCLVFSLYLATRLKTISLDELHGMFIENADEPYSETIARSIISSRKKGMDISTTTQLQTIIKKVKRGRFYRHTKYIMPHLP